MRRPPPSLFLSLQMSEYEGPWERLPLSWKRAILKLVFLEASNMYLILGSESCDFGNFPKYSITVEL